MSRKAPSLAEINSDNREFWAKEQELMLSRMADKTLLKIAFAQIEDEHLRGVPIKNRQAFESALAKAESLKKELIREHAKAAAGAPRLDRLQTLILEIVTQNLDITEKKLREQLEREVGGGVIEDIDEETIGFIDARGQGRSAPLKGLKDRLSRAKKIVRAAAR